MAFIACPECGSQVSTSEAACPACGHPAEATDQHAVTETLLGRRSADLRQQLVDIAARFGHHYL